MAHYRLINCSFLNAGSFKVNVSNKGKLLYLSMLTSADDCGFVDNTTDIINALETNDNEFEKTENMALLENTYKTALQELIDKGLLYEFVDNHSNKVHLIRHWFYHNKWKVGLWTNYQDFRDKVYIKSNEYVLGKKPLKEDKIKEDNTSQDNTKHSKSNTNDEEEADLDDLFKNR